MPQSILQEDIVLLGCSKETQGEEKKVTPVPHQAKFTNQAEFTASALV